MCLVAIRKGSVSATFLSHGNSDGSEYIGHDTEENFSGWVLQNEVGLYI